MIESRRISWAGHVVCMGRSGMHTGICQESQKERDHFEDQDIGRTIILKWIFGWYGLDSSASGVGPVAGSCEQSDQIFGLQKMLRNS
jgi:hypothetical protein